MNILPSRALPCCLRTISIIQRKLNPGLEVLGILLTMFDRRNNLSFRVWEEVNKCFNDTVFKTVIPRNVKLSESPSHGKPALLYDISSRGAESYLQLASEITGKEEPGVKKDPLGRGLSAILKDIEEKGSSSS